MEILVCIKQVPDDSVEIFLNENTQKPDLEKVTPVVNAFDTYALEMAVRLKEAAGGEVTVLSVGDDSVKNSLKNCMAVGADHAYLCKLDDYNETDTFTIAQSLKESKEEIEKQTGKTFDIIFCGKESTDFASAQVGPVLAEMMDIPVITGIVDIEEKDGGVETRQETEEGYHVISCQGLCLVTVNKPKYDPRYPTIKSKMAARKKAIDELDTAKAGVTVLHTEKVYTPAKRSAGVKIQAESAEEAVAQAMDLMKKAKVF
ncbi:MAG TPA: electron transfer flavoprotein subunit beta/FixA family protein [Candidatus Eubacterium avistercoris]|uniref:Electron transfer flavoprotein small subunit n=1 Tax=Candidatus Eubacterium avistercoris TaxID=2838567 RepID=A0A9D2D0M0_9FIRM|nr:electron transfer flavoprotein subunit beta/FixA family protein [Candidatus Eubacterium avistercoris]